VRMDWNAVHQNQPRRGVPLPGYPFERHKHWVPRPRALTTTPMPYPGPTIIRPVAPEAIVDTSDASPAPPSEAPPHLSWRGRLAHTTTNDRPTLLRDYLQRTINTLLGHDPSRTVETARPLAELGIDSLASIQLGERLAQDLGASLPVRVLLGGNLETLARALADQLAAHKTHGTHG